MGFEKVPSITMMNMGIAAAVSILLPIILLIVWKQKKRVKLAPFFVGALIFIVFVLILESICHQFFLVKDSALSRFVNGNLWAYILYACLAAGIFEETGRFIAYKLFLRKNNDKETAVTYGIGHGGIEAIILVGFGMISSMILVATLNNMGGLDQYLALLPADMQELVKPGLLPLYTAPSYIYLINGVERVITIVFHIALSVLVFMAAKRPGKLYFYPLSILLHAFLNVFAVLCQKGILHILVTELLLLIIAAGTAYLAYRVYIKDTNDIEHVEPQPEAVMEEIQAEYKEKE